MDKKNMPESLEECLRGVRLSIDGGEKGIKICVAGNILGVIAGISLIANQASTHLGIPLETIANGIIASPELMRGKTVTAVDLGKLPPDMSEKLRKRITEGG